MLPGPVRDAGQGKGTRAEKARTLVRPPRSEGLGPRQAVCGQSTPSGTGDISMVTQSGDRDMGQRDGYCGQHGPRATGSPHSSGETGKMMFK